MRAELCQLFMFTVMTSWHESWYGGRRDTTSSMKFNRRCKKHFSQNRFSYNPKQREIFEAIYLRVQCDDTSEMSDNSHSDELQYLFDELEKSNFKNDFWLTLTLFVSSPEPGGSTFHESIVIVNINKRNQWGMVPISKNCVVIVCKITKLNPLCSQFAPLSFQIDPTSYLSLLETS